MKPADVITLAREVDAKSVDLKFIDLPGRWQHFSIPISELEEGIFEDGLGFDGSSIEGWKGIESSDMLVIPDSTTAKVDPFIATKTISLLCDIVDPITRESYGRDPRGVARRAEAYLKSTGIGDTAFYGPEAEFFIFDAVQFGQEMNAGWFEIDSNEGIWNSGRALEGNLGHRPRSKGGYFPVSPVDAQQDIRDEMVAEMEGLGIRVERQHHEVATAGQAEIDIRFDSLLAMADKLMWFKHVVKNVAARNGKTATFMPKPLFGDNGSGMHTHQSIWKNGKPTFAGDRYGGLSDSALWYIGGLLKHADALCALTNPTTNSYRRLVPGFEAPNKLAYSARNRSAAIRIPTYSPAPAAKRLEYRTPDPTCNPYLAFAAMLMAGLDGIQNRIDPGQPLDVNIYDLPPEEARKVRSAPGSLDASLEALRKDHEFLLKGDVFSRDIVETWIDWKYDKDVNPVRIRPVPWEYHLYWDM
jgi:glutamine synthetase